jgi:hypothetical protein
MAFNKDEMIEQLKFEISMVEKGRYYPSVREPLKTPEIFRDTITCLNVGLSQKKYPCSACFLSEFAPRELKDSQGELCHKIPLNRKAAPSNRSRLRTIPTGSAKSSWVG